MPSLFLLRLVYLQVGGCEVEPRLQDEVVRRVALGDREPIQPLHLALSSPRVHEDTLEHETFEEVLLSSREGIGLDAHDRIRMAEPGMGPVDVLDHGSAAQML